MLHFTKMHGISNDYIYVDGFRETVADPERAAVLLSDRHTGVGGDGLVLILPSEVADLRMRMFNADGSEGKMCGNATRCIGKYAYEHGLVKKERMTLETLSGIKELTLAVRAGEVERVTVDMGEAVLRPSEIPADFPGERAVDVPLTVDGTEYRVTCVSMGNPHAVLFVDSVADLPLERLGPRFERHPAFPERVNTEFARVVGRNELEMRVWERGSGETMACGTGACATAVAAVLLGHCARNEEITVHLRGGDLAIRWLANNHVEMSGPATEVFHGEIDL